MAQIFRFGDFELDTGAYELRASGRAVPVEPLVFDLIVTLLAERGRIVSRDLLIERVWAGRIVSESTISTAIKSARKALGDSGESQRFIRTVRGRGVQFIGEVETGAPAMAAGAGPAPMLYVRTTDGGHGAAFTARLCAVLGRIPLLRIAAPFDEADATGDPRRLRETLGVTLLLQVRLDRAGGRLHADVVLIDTATARQLWAKAFDAPEGPDAAEALLQQVVARVEPEILRAMIAGLGADGDETAEPLVLRAVALLALRGWNRSTFGQASAMIARAIELEPALPLSHALLALILAVGHRVGALRDDTSVVPRAIAAADRALGLDNGDSNILGLAGCALSDVGEVDRAVPLLRKAIDLDPSNGQAQTALGAALMARRDFDGAVHWLEQGMRISPADTRLSVWGGLLAIAELVRGDAGKARSVAEAACAEDDRNYLPRLALAAVCVETGDGRGLASAVRETLRTNPDLTETEVLCSLGQRWGEPVWQAVSEQQASA